MKYIITNGDRNYSGEAATGHKFCTSIHELETETYSEEEATETLQKLEEEGEIQAGEFWIEKQN